MTDDWMWLPELTLEDHLRLFLQGGSDSAQQALELFGLQECGERMPHTLSSGQAQRAALCSVVVRPWQVLLLDEPEQRLDDEYREALSRVIEAYLPGRVVVVATHAHKLFSGLPSQNIRFGA